MTDKDTQAMAQYANYLEQFAAGVTRCCNQLQSDFSSALSCMDSSSRLLALKELVACVEEIKKATPIADDTAKKLVKAKKILDGIGNIRYR